MQPISTGRREFLKTAAASAIAATGVGVRRAQAQPVPYSTGTEPPKLKAPADACDCHMHIYDAKYPIAPTATLKPPDAVVAGYKLLQRRIGTTRNVVVTPSTYGTDTGSPSTRSRKSARQPEAWPSSMPASPTPNSGA
jgi:hypothetical protein